jgi:hypothetical protein
MTAFLDTDIPPLGLAQRSVCSASGESRADGKSARRLKLGRAPAWRERSPALRALAAPE